MQDQFLFVFAMSFLLYVGTLKQASVRSLHNCIAMHQIVRFKSREDFNLLFSDDWYGSYRLYDVWQIEDPERACWNSSRTIKACYHFIVEGSSPAAK